MIGLDSDRVPARLTLPGSDPLRHCCQRSLACDYHLSSLYLFPSLGIVANISKEDATAFLDKQQPRASSKAAKISDVGKMTDEQRVKAGGRKMLSECFLAAAVIHSAEFNRRKCSIGPSLC